MGGGLRKVRVALPGRSKRDRARLVFLFVGGNRPVFLLTVFAKNEKANLSIEGQRALINAVKSDTVIHRRNL